MIIEIKAAFPIEWGAEYYTVESKKKKTFASCVVCDNTGKVTIKGEEYTCSRCKGNWREQEVTGEATVYFVEKWKLSSAITKCRGGKSATLLRFARINTDSTGGYYNTLDFESWELTTMETSRYGEPKKIYNDYKVALAEAKRLNAAQKEEDDG